MHLQQKWSSSHDIDNTFCLYPDVGIQMCISIEVCKYAQKARYAAALTVIPHAWVLVFKLPKYCVSFEPAAAPERYDLGLPTPGVRS